jgi:hypothetical protein
MTWVNRLFFKAAFVLILIYLALSMLSAFIRSMSTLELVIIFAVLSVTAYNIRKRIAGVPAKRPHSGSGGERTPIMPRKNVI